VTATLQLRSEMETRFAAAMEKGVESSASSLELVV